MRMKSCPHCGAQNSIKRTTCYQCQQPLAATPPPQQTETNPASRWEAIELGREGKQRVLRPGSKHISLSPPEAPSEAKKPHYLPSRRSALSHIRRMSVFFRELQTLTRTGITLAPACREIERRSPRGLREMARDMAEAAEQGKPVSSAMEAHRALLYPWHVGLVKAAEAGGFIPEAFEQIAHAYDIEWDTRSALRLRFFFYVVLGLPAILLSLPLLLTIRQPIPPEGWTPLTVIETVKHYFRTVSFPIAAGVTGLISLWQVLQSITWFQAVQQQIVSRLPIVGRVARATALDRYLATLGLMLRGGVPIAQAAEEAALAAGNSAITPKLLDFVPRLREGGTLTELLAGSKLLDTDTLNMMATGEVSGSMPDMLARAAGYYREENEAKRKMLIRLAQLLFGVAWIIAFGALILFGIKVYFDFAFKTMEWMLEGFE